MRYYKFNRDRTIFLLHKYGKSLKKTSYMANTNRSKLLESYYYDSQTWGALHKAWKGYVIAKNKQEHDRMEYYAAVIQKLQNELGLRVSSFHDIGMSALKFYSSQCSKYLDNNKEMIQDESLKDRDDEDEHFNGDFIRDRFTS